MGNVNSNYEGPPARFDYDTELMTNYALDRQSKPQQNQSYTITSQLYDKQNNPIANASALLQATSVTVVQLNGKNIQLGINPIRVAFDDMGEICIIALSTGISTPSFTFSFFRDKQGGGVNMNQITVDPSAKVLVPFQNLQNGNDLKVKPGRSGRPLDFGANSPAAADLDVAAKAFKDMSLAAKDFPPTPGEIMAVLLNVMKQPLVNDGWPPAGQVGPSKLGPIEVMSMTGLSLPGIPSLPKGGDIVKAGSSIVDDLGKGAANTWGKVKSGIEGKTITAKDGVVHTAKQASDLAGWILNEAETQWAYTLKLLGRAWTFILKTAEDVGKALDIVWNALKLGWNELVKWVGWIFEWQAIIAASASIQSFLRFSLQYYSTNITTRNNPFDSVVNRLKVSMGQKTSTMPATPTQVGHINTQAQSEPGGQAQKSTPAKWLGHQVKYGGLTDVKPISPVESTSSFDLADRVSSSLEGVFTTLDSVVGQLLAGMDVFNLRGIDDLLKTLSDTVVNGVVDVLGAILAELKGVSTQLLSVIDNASTEKINVPILSDIYETMTGDRLSIFSAVCLMVAIPATVSAKLVTGSAFPSFDDSLKAILSNAFDQLTGWSGSTVSTFVSVNNSKKAGSLKKDDVAAMSLAAANDNAQKATGADTAAALGLVAGTAVEVCVSIWDRIDQGRSGGNLNLTPSTGVKFFKVGASLLKFLAAICSVPLHSNLPGFEVRCSISTIRILLTLMNFMIVSKMRGVHQPGTLKAVRRIDFASAIITAPLAWGVCGSEYQAKTWTNYSEKRTSYLLGATTFGFFASCLEYDAYRMNFANPPRPEISQLWLGMRMWLQMGRLTCLTLRLDDSWEHGAPPAFL